MSPMLLWLCQCRLTIPADECEINSYAPYKKSHLNHAWNIRSTVREADLETPYGLKNILRGHTPLQRGTILYCQVSRYSRARKPHLSNPIPTSKTFFPVRSSGNSRTWFDSADSEFQDRVCHLPTSFISEGRQNM